LYPRHHPPFILTLTLLRFALSLASPVHSYGVSADLHFMRFIIMSLFTLLIIVSFSIGDGKSLT